VVAILFSAHLALVIYANLFTRSTKVNSNYRALIPDETGLAVSVATASSVGAHDLVHALSYFSRSESLAILEETKTVGFQDVDGNHRQYTLTAFQVGGLEQDVRLLTSAGHALVFRKGQGFSVESTSSGDSGLSCVCGDNELGTDEFGRRNSLKLLSSLRRSLLADRRFLPMFPPYLPPKNPNPAKASFGCVSCDRGQYDTDGLFNVDDFDSSDFKINSADAYGINDFVNNILSKADFENRYEETMCSHLTGNNQANCKSHYRTLYQGKLSTFHTKTTAAVSNMEANNAGLVADTIDAWNNGAHSHVTVAFNYLKNVDGSLSGKSYCNMQGRTVVFDSWLMAKAPLSPDGSWNFYNGGNKPFYKKFYLDGAPFETSSSSTSCHWKHGKVRSTTATVYFRLNSNWKCNWSCTYWTVSTRTCVGRIVTSVLKYSGSISSSWWNSVGRKVETESGQKIEYTECHSSSKASNGCYWSLDVAGLFWMRKGFSTWTTRMNNWDYPKDASKAFSKMMNKFPAGESEHLSKQAYKKFSKTFEQGTTVSWRSPDHTVNDIDVETANIYLGADMTRFYDDIRKGFVEEFNSNVAGDNYDYAQAVTDFTTTSSGGDQWGEYFGDVMDDLWDNVPEPGKSSDSFTFTSGAYPVQTNSLFADESAFSNAGDRHYEYGCSGTDLYAFITHGYRQSLKVDFEQFWGNNHLKRVPQQMSEEDFHLMDGIEGSDEKMLQKCSTYGTLREFHMWSSALGNYNFIDM
jgi:hypothetical protein